MSVTGIVVDHRLYTYITRTFEQVKAELNDNIILVSKNL